MSQIGETKRSKLWVTLFSAALLHGCIDLPPPRAKPSDTLEYEKVSDIERPSPYSDALALYLSDRCDAAWNLLWPIAKLGDNDARFILAESLYMGCDLPHRNGRTADEESHLYNVLEAYAISEPVKYPFYQEHEQLFREQLGGLNLFYHYAGAKEAAACYIYLVDSKDGSLAGAKKCLDKAISLGVIKHFKDFAADVDPISNN
jgi:hypothetical protein